MGDTVDTRSSGYLEMSTKWDLLHDLLGGTTTMRAAGSTWLPKEPKESQEKYSLRISRSFLYNAFGSTLDELVSKPFSRAVTIEIKNLDQRLVDMIDDVDKKGANVTGFARRQFKSLLTYGLTHVLVDFPNVDPEQNLAEERKSGDRPNWILVEPPNLIGWRFDGDELESIRILELKTVNIGAYEDELVEFIRIYTRTGFELWEKVDKEFILRGEGVHSFGAVPLVTTYIEKTGPLTGSPPLSDLAWLNLAHWQSLSDQRSILRMIRSGILFGKGFAKDELDKLVIGPNSLVETTNPDADLRYVEHSGKAIESGAKDIREIEERMEILGLKPLIERTSNSTATGKMIDESRTHSNIQSWIRTLENSLVDQFKFSAQWMDISLPEDFAIDIFNDFGISVRGASDLGSLIMMRDKRQITHETFLREAKRRSILSESLDVGVEVQLVKTEDNDDFDD